MATPARRCLNCGAPLAGRDARTKTCSNACRQALKRKREQAHADRAKEPGSVAALAREIHDEYGRRSPVRQVVMEELRPVVREAIDENVLKAIGAFVALTPAAIAALTEDLGSDDPLLRQRAYSLVVKYALDNQHITPARKDRPTLQIQVELPRPGTEPRDDAPEAPLDAVPLKRCASCGDDLPENAFPADGPMCDRCLEQRKTRVTEALLSKDAVREQPTAALLQRPSSSGGPEVREAGTRLQPSDLRPSGVDEERPPDHPWAAQSRKAAGTWGE